MKDSIRVIGAKEHNLKNVSLDIPKNKLVVFTGVSGSGKSSLAMDTLYAEGQRRYVESLSAYARQFLGIMKRPEVESIDGLSPAIAIDQHALSHNPRSTVGTVTEIYDYLRVLFARVGHPHCPKCGREISRQTSESICDQILGLAKTGLGNGGSKYFRFMILSPIVRDRRGEFSKLLDNIKNKGFDQVRIDGHFFKLFEEIWLIKTNRHNIDVVVDKLSLTKADLEKKEIRQRIKDDIEIGLGLSDGLIAMSQINDPSFVMPDKPKDTKDTTFSQRFACPDCSLSLPEIEPRMFSFNSPQGACPECNGLGVKLRVDTTKVSMWRAAELEKRYYSTTSDEIREEIEKLMIKQTCALCSGARLRQESLTVTIDNKTIADVCGFPLDKFWQWIKELAGLLSTEKEREIAVSLINEISQRVSFLNSVGVDYLTLGRAAATLSAGEGQRIRLASQVGSGLSGVLYILDEPTVGLHPKDTRKLIETLKNLRDLDNTVVLVEHDREVMEASDWIVDFGPGAGSRGGKIIAQGTCAQIKHDNDSITGKYLSGKEIITILPKQSKLINDWITIEGCKEHNLKNVKVKLPLGRFVCVGGISGSGKSTLITDTLYPAIRKALNPDLSENSGEYKSLKNADLIDRVLLVDQSPIGRTSRSNPATYTGVFTDIRSLFTETREAKMKGFGQGFFSFNTTGGRCEACEGQGQTRIQMQFLPDVWVECEVCKGRRFKPEVLEVEFKEKNISQVLDMTIQEALEFFSAIPTIVRKLEVLNRIGLSYLQLGQLSPTLSGGESQRLKLARELVKRGDGKTLYLLDEPTTGLHFADLKKLMIVLRALVDRGDTVLVIEHNLEILKQADWLIEMGPEGGEKGGYIIAEGTVEDIIKNKESITAKYLKEVV